MPTFLNTLKNERWYKISTSMKKAIAGIIIIAIICIAGFYSYSYITAKNNFTIKELQGYGSGEELLWTDNLKYNKYDISFGTLN
ncbi:hypothetical protein Clopa_2729 [Clostridium pasteurianum BC1]|uniref:Uncharacterized protein n=2 Tax=Clostridium pasteurianum TaxID=1501 RepID=R4KAP4_CLOPA|nr:hypothetical protein Clopa_2729 [Clostridium pasteurianum BC1]